VGSDVRTRGPKDPQNIAKGVSWRRASKPREVASTTLFDMSDAASYVTAQRIGVVGEPNLAPGGRRLTQQRTVPTPPL
jgi:NAD(P)-dependent dehydrogenase (short-subunit alcohol dehydrogenase family)